MSSIVGWQTCVSVCVCECVCICGCVWVWVSFWVFVCILVSEWVWLSMSEELVSEWLCVCLYMCAPRVYRTRQRRCQRPLFIPQRVNTGIDLEIRRQFCWIAGSKWNRSIKGLWQEECESRHEYKYKGNEEILKHVTKDNVRWRTISFRSSFDTATPRTCT